MNALRHWLIFGTLLAGLMMVHSGCKKADSLPKSPVPQRAKGSHDDHPEKGPHGGTLVEWGQEEYHAEFTVDHKAKTVTVYVLDNKAEKAPQVEPGKIVKVMLRVTNVSPSITLELKYEPAKSDVKGIAFTGSHEQFAKEMDFEGMINGTINGEIFIGELKAGGHEPESKKK